MPVVQRSILAVPRASSAGAKHWAKAKLSKDLAHYWEVQPERHRRFLPRFTPGTPKELSLPRKVLGRLLAERSGHGDFAEYHQRFQHDTAKLQCACGTLKAPGHFLQCRRAQQLSLLLPTNPSGPPSLEYIVSTQAGARAFANWPLLTDFFGKHQPRQPRHAPPIL